MKLSPTHAGVGMFVVLGLSVLAWTLLRAPDEVGPSESADMFVAPSTASAPTGSDSPPPAFSSPAEVAVALSPPPEATPDETSSESLATQPLHTTLVLRNDRPPEQDLYPSPIETHLEVTGQTVSALATALELDEEAGRVLDRIIAEHVRAERALWDEAKVDGDGVVDEGELERIGRRTLGSIRRSPELGEGMARVFERLLVPLVRDPGRTIDPDQTVVFGITELRSLARGE